MEMYEKRRQHVHPMVYEDLLANLQRMTQKVIETNAKMDVIKKQNEEIKL